MIGEKLGKYTILETIGAGSMGTVYRAEDPSSQKPVAIKVIRSQILYDCERRERFLRELLPVTEVHHKGICPILEIGDDEDDFFVVMPLLAAKNLDQFRERKAIPWPQALEIAIAAAEALAATHAHGAVHRGLKPSNLWIQDDGSVLISDCSLARFTEIPKKSRTRNRGERANFAQTLIPLAALAYMSPEQIRGDEVDFRTDIFSFGVILHEMLTGHHPFESRNSLSRMSAILEGDPAPVSSRAQVPPEFDAIVTTALAKSPQDRYQTTADFVKALQAIREHYPDAPAATKSVVQTRWKFPQRPMLLLALLFFLTVIGIVVMLNR